ncbi:TetR/AcrR family transcriptional regulator [Streptomyces oceani]|uniref:TetR/AcrR family transcriptional regulator n=1 Tax=Streptomyces oceani TaxID=1075402 RepID=UPI000873102C|nr:TetR/AcrR family transcriptional regulator C-terminal domain-containing protein [Streptomyces oceani]
MSYWTRPAPEVQRRRALSSSRIAVEATALLDAEGLDALTLRRLASRLGVAQSSLYRHVRTAEEVLDLALDHALGVDPALESAAAGGDLGALLNSWYQHLTRHTWAPEVVVRRPLLGPRYLALSDTLCARVLARGTPPDQVLEVTYALSNYVLGCAVASNADQGQPPDTAAVRQEEHPALATALRAAPSRDASFHRGLEALLRSVGGERATDEAGRRQSRRPSVN